MTATENRLAAIEEELRTLRRLFRVRQPGEAVAAILARLHDVEVRLTHLEDDRPPPPKRSASKRTR